MNEMTEISFGGWSERMKIRFIRNRRTWLTELRRSPFRTARKELFPCCLCKMPISRFQKYHAYKGGWIYRAHGDCSEALLKETIRDWRSKYVLPLGRR